MPESGTGTSWSQGPQDPLANNAATYPALFPGSALPQEPHTWPQGTGALPSSCRSGNLTHLFHSPVHPIGITRGEMGQDLGTVNAFPEEGVVLEGRERKM